MLCFMILSRVMFHDLQDGRVTCGENCGIAVLGLLTGVLGITALVTMIWVGIVYSYFLIVRK